MPRGVRGVEKARNTVLPAVVRRPYCPKRNQGSGLSPPRNQLSTRSGKTLHQAGAILPSGGGAHHNHIVKDQLWQARSEILFIPQLHAQSRDRCSKGFAGAGEAAGAEAGAATESRREAAAAGTGAAPGAPAAGAPPVLARPGWCYSRPPYAAVTA